jgi:hypothetical protein
MNWRKIKNKLAGMMLLFIFVLPSVGILLIPGTLYAQIAAVPEEYAPLEASDQIKTAEEKASKVVFQTIVGALVTALVNLTTHFANQFAHDAAVWVASGGNAEEPLFETRPAEDYIIYAGATVASQVINELVEDNIIGDQFADFNVCAPPDLPSLRMGIQSAYEPMDLEVCGDTRAFLDNWGGFIKNTTESITDTSKRQAAVLKAVSDSFDPNVNSLSVSLGLYTDTLIAGDKKGKFDLFELIQNDRFKGVTDFITGDVRTPAEEIKRKWEQSDERVEGVPYDITTAIIQNPEALLQIGVAAGSVFTSTLLQEMTQKLADGFFEPVEFGNPFDEFGSSVASRGAAAEKLKSILSFTPLEVTNFSLINEFTTCPASVRGTSRGLYHCVMDTSFASIVARAESGQAVTLAQAVEEGLVDGGWSLIPSTDVTRNQDSNCYTYGFCHANLVKLRKARIIPTGWEMAADAQENIDNGPFSLQEVMDGFTDCNVDNQRDGGHPWCHLIDPNWVLKYPDTQCRTMAHGQILEVAGGDTRAQECVDYTSCISEDEDGTCSGGYGYCVREKNVWEFRGDSCPEEYASCLTFKTPRGQVENFLTTSVDYGPCGQDNAGCLWYSTEKEDQGDGTFDWLGVSDVAAQDASTTAYKERIYFTAAVEECNDQNGGCSELIERTEGLRLNLVQNSSFEDDADENNAPDAWVAGDYSAVEYSELDIVDRSGGSAMNVGTDVLYQYGIELAQSSFYTLSAYARLPEGGGANTIDLKLTLRDENGVEANLNGTSYTPSCTLFSSRTIGVVVAPTTESYERFECTFTSPTFADPSSSVIAAVKVLNGTGDVWLDDIQIEQAEDASIYHKDYTQAATQALDYVKLPPRYLGCTGDIADPEECADYAQICSEGDAGCSAYAPTNGDPIVTGVASELDQCDAACSGYDTYKQEPTLYEPVGAFPVYLIPDTALSCSEQAVGCDEFTNLDTEQREYVTYLRSCVTQDQAGAEESVYYTWEGADVEGYQLRRWDLIESDISAAPCTNWFATEDGVTCDDDANADFVYDSFTQDCDEHNDIFANPDCREFVDQAGAIHYRLWRDTVTVNNACVSYRKTELEGLGSDDDSSGTDDGQENCTDSGGYFNTDSNICIYYGYLDESDLCSESENGCRKYTGGQSGNSRVVLQELFEQGTLSAWHSGSGAEVTLTNDSIATDGHSIRSTNDRNIETYQYDHGSICETPGGCDSGVGNLGGSCTVPEGEQYCGTLEKQLFAGKTYTLSFWAKGTGEISAFFRTATGVNTLFVDHQQLNTDWTRYTFGPLDMNEMVHPDFGEGTILRFRSDDSDEFLLDTIVLREGESNINVIKDSWITPAICDQTPTGDISPQYQLGCQEYLDQDSDLHYLKSFSRLCSENKVGCDAFFATAQSSSAGASTRNATCNNYDGSVVTDKTACYLQLNIAGTDFESASQKVCDIIPGESSCQFDLDWTISDWHLDNVDEFDHIEYGPDTVITPADRSLYAVVNSEVRCSSTNAGCQEVGFPVFSADQSRVEEWEAKYLMNLPADYDTILCQEDELFCEEWSSNSEGTWYFKNPQDRICEYKTNVTISGSSYDGWFRADTTDFCYGSGSCSISGSACTLDSECGSDEKCNILDGSYIIAGVESAMWRNGDADYNGWVGACTSEWDGCSEFQDTLDFDEDEFYGQQDGEKYFFIDNDNLDENTLLSSQRCNGQASLELGCVPFSDTGDVGLDYNASATIVASAHADELFGGEKFDLVDPINCERGDSSITTPDGRVVDLCAQRCAYLNSELDPVAPAGRPVATVFSFYQQAGSCFVNSDCPTYESTTGDPVQGTCETNLEDPSGALFTLPVSRLENDTNRILKVNRDRECSEWLTGAAETKNWDVATSSWRNIYSAIQLCQRYEKVGGTPICADVIADDPAIVLDVDRYANREVGWYGEDYSGYAIPDMFPLQHLEQVNIEPAQVCVTTAGIVTTRSCSEDDDCLGSDTCENNKEDDWRLAFNAGACSENHGDSCNIGYCSANGLPCSADEACGTDGGSCIAGVCENALGEVTGDCPLNRICGGGNTCKVSKIVKDKSGSCYRGSCIVSIQGESFDKNNEEIQICRAHPEANSPFPNEVVELWTDGYGSNVENAPTIGYIPYNVVSGFEGVSLCAPGENCECSYKKISASNTSPVYASLETLVGVDQELKGICVGGDAMGAFCASDADCFASDPLDPIEDICQWVSREDLIYGLPGFCLERDGSINIHADPDSSACITWLPVDQLQGQTDLYAKYLTAGYFQDVYTCMETRPYVNLRISNLEQTGVMNRGVACAETHQSGGAGECTKGNSHSDMVNDCVQGAYCPEGFFSIVGQCLPNTGYDNGVYAFQCTENANDCPYICVPEDAYHASDSNGNDLDSPWQCQRPGADNAVEEALGYKGSDGSTDEYTITNSIMDESFQQTVYTWAKKAGTVPNPGDDPSGNLHFSEFDTVVNAYKDCVASGIPWAEVDSEQVTGFAPSYQWQFDHTVTQTCDNGGDGSVNGVVNQFRCLGLNYEVYPGCEEVVKVANGEESYIYTDKLFKNTGVETTPDSLDYIASTSSEPFGATKYSPEDVAITDQLPASPMRIGACSDGRFTEGVTSAFGPDVNDIQIPTNIESCGAGFGEFDSSTLYYGSEGHNSADPEARSFIDFGYNGSDDLGGTGFIVSFRDWTTNGDFKTDLFERMNQVFAKINLNNQEQFWKWKNENWDDDRYQGGGDVEYQRTDWDDPDYRYDFVYSPELDVRGVEGDPPTIWALDLDKCFGAYCEEGPPDNLTVNNQNSGSQSFSGGFTLASLRFFAAADPDQLPIRRVIIDWGDGNPYMGSTSPDNYYQNHRGLQDGSSSASKCDLETEWGLTDDSCDPNYFNFTYTYTCNNPETLPSCSVADKNADGDLLEPCEDAGRCAFQPRVHIRDNWGWCSGTCTLGDEGSEGCFENYVDTLSPSGAGSLDDDAECAYLNFPDPPFFTENDPWIYYDGIIYVDSE